MDQMVIDRVQGSWAEVSKISDQAAALFYQNLFEADPSIKPLFKGDMGAQGKKLMQMIGAAVGKLNEVETLIPILQNLGKRHVEYGVVKAHYATVGAALLLTLEQGLGPAFTPEVKAAWAEVYGIVSTVMLAGAEA